MQPQTQTRPLLPQTPFIVFSHKLWQRTRQTKLPSGRRSQILSIKIQLTKLPLLGRLPTVSSKTEVSRRTSQMEGGVQTTANPSRRTIPTGKRQSPIQPSCRRSKPAELRFLTLRRTPPSWIFPCQPPAPPSLPPHQHQERSRRAARHPKTVCLWLPRMHWAV